jgi:hypothetical protein
MSWQSARAENTPGKSLFGAAITPSCAPVANTLARARKTDAPA